MTARHQGNYVHKYHFVHHFMDAPLLVLKRGCQLKVLSGNEVTKSEVFNDKIVENQKRCAVINFMSVLMVLWNYLNMLLSLKIKFKKQTLTILNVKIKYVLLNLCVKCLNCLPSPSATSIPCLTIFTPLLILISMPRQYQILNFTNFNKFIMPADLKI